MRFSRQRQVIMKILSTTKEHPDADWVYKEARKVISNISLGTVYRNLKLLTEKGDVITIETEIGGIRYDADVSQHSHFVCNKCHAIHDLCIDNAPIDEIRSKGYYVSSCKFIFYGYCQECLKLITPEKATKEEIATDNVKFGIN